MMNDFILMFLWGMLVGNFFWGMFKMIHITNQGYDIPKRIIWFTFGAFGSSIFFWFQTALFNGFAILMTWLIIFSLGLIDILITAQEKKLLAKVKYIMSMENFDELVDDMQLFWAHDRSNNYIVVHDDIKKFNKTSVIFAITRGTELLARNRHEASHVLHRV